MIDEVALLKELEELFHRREEESRFTGKRDASVTWNDAIYYIKTAPVIDAGPRKAFDEILWENDVMRKQLADIGKSFGEKMDDVVKVVRCKGCRWGGHTICEASGMNTCGFGDEYCSYGEREDDEHTD